MTLDSLPCKITIDKKTSWVILISYFSGSMMFKSIFGAMFIVFMSVIPAYTQSKTAQFEVQHKNREIKDAPSSCII